MCVGGYKVLILPCSFPDIDIGRFKGILNLLWTNVLRVGVITAKPSFLCDGIWSRKCHIVVVSSVNIITIAMLQDSHTLILFALNLQGIFTSITDAICNLQFASNLEPHDLDE